MPLAAPLARVRRVQEIAELARRDRHGHRPRRLERPGVQEAVVVGVNRVHQVERAHGLHVVLEDELDIVRPRLRDETEVNAPGAPVQVRHAPGRHRDPVRVRRPDRRVRGGAGRHRLTVHVHERDDDRRLGDHPGGENRVGLFADGDVSRRRRRDLWAVRHNVIDDEPVVGVHVRAVGVLVHLVPGQVVARERRVDVNLLRDGRRRARAAKARDGRVRRPVHAAAGAPRAVRRDRVVRLQEVLRARSKVLVVVVLFANFREAAAVLRVISADRARGQRKCADVVRSSTAV
eukprot:30173-Pelagococcus_subviridis.AAC.7